MLLLVIIKQNQVDFYLLIKQNEKKLIHAFNSDIKDEYSTPADEEMETEPATLNPGFGSTKGYLKSSRKMHRYILWNF